MLLTKNLEMTDRRRRRRRRRRRPKVVPRAAADFVQQLKISKLYLRAFFHSFGHSSIAAAATKVSFWPHLRENHYTDDGGDHHHIFGGAHMEDLFLPT